MSSLTAAIGNHHEYYYLDGEIKVNRSGKEATLVFVLRFKSMLTSHSNGGIRARPSPFVLGCLGC